MTIGKFAWADKKQNWRYAEINLLEYLSFLKESKHGMRIK